MCWYVSGKTSSTVRIRFLLVFRFFYLVCVRRCSGDTVERHLLYLFLEVLAGQEEHALSHDFLIPFYLGTVAGDGWLEIAQVPQAYAVPFEQPGTDRFRHRFDDDFTGGFGQT